MSWLEVVVVNCEMAGRLPLFSDHLPNQQSYASKNTQKHSLPPDSISTLPFHLSFLHCVLQTTL